MMKRLIVLILAFAPFVINAQTDLSKWHDANTILDKLDANITTLTTNVTTNTDHLTTHSTQLDGYASGKARAGFYLVDVVTPDSYESQLESNWTTSTDITSGGTYGIYGQTNVAHSVQNANAVWGRLGFESLAAAETINSGSGINGALYLDDTYAITVTDNVSAISAFVDGTGAVTAVSSASTMNGYNLAWNSVTNFGIETNGLFIQTIEASDLDYGVQIQSSSAMTAGLYLRNHASNATATMTSGILMESAASKMTYGVNMTGAGITGAEILCQNGATIDNIQTDTLDLTETIVKVTGTLYVTGDISSGGTTSDYAITDYQPPLLDYWAKTQELNKLPAFENIDRTNIVRYINGLEESAERNLRYIMELEARITQLEND